MNVVEHLEIERWSGPFAVETQRKAVAALESGMVLFCPRLAFALEERESGLLSAQFSSGTAKNISLDPAEGSLRGAAAGENEERLNAMIRRFAQCTAQLVTDLFPCYRNGIRQARTSYRPVEIAGRSSSPRKDDKLLHVDAFPSRPTNGRRILRVFSNVNPTGKTRVWHVGEPFQDFAHRFVRKARKPYVLESWLLATLGITKGRRSAYDQIMLGLHDLAKLDAQYQREAPQIEIAFPPGTTWICYTDQVLHAAIAGQFALEQTFHIDVSSMADPERSPIRVLEKMTGQVLA